MENGLKITFFSFSYKISTLSENKLFIYFQNPPFDFSFLLFLPPQTHCLGFRFFPRKKNKNLKNLILPQNRIFGLNQIAESKELKMLVLRSTARFKKKIKGKKLHVGQKLKKKKLKMKISPHVTFSPKYFF